MLSALLADWRVSLRARGRSLATIASYLSIGESFDAYLAAIASPPAVDRLRREHVEAYLAGMRERGLSPATVAKHYRSLQQPTTTSATAQSSQYRPPTCSGKSSTAPAPTYQRTPSKPANELAPSRTPPSEPPRVQWRAGSPSRARTYWCRTCRVMTYSDPDTPGDGRGAVALGR